MAAAVRPRQSLWALAPFARLHPVTVPTFWRRSSTLAAPTSYATSAASPSLAAASTAVVSMAGAMLQWPGHVGELLGGFLWTAPKKRVTHRKKRLRMTMKWLKPIQNGKHCNYCGQPMYLSHVCAHCVKEVMALFKLRQQKQS